MTYVTCQSTHWILFCTWKRQIQGRNRLGSAWRGQIQETAEKQDFPETHRKHTFLAGAHTQLYTPLMNNILPHPTHVLIVEEKLLIPPRSLPGHLQRNATGWGWWIHQDNLQMMGIHCPAFSSYNKQDLNCTRDCAPSLWLPTLFFSHSQPANSTGSSPFLRLRLQISLWGLYVTKVLPLSHPPPFPDQL